MSEYRVSTEVYSGPMDLLLYLIRREEVDIYDIPMARITAQYVDYVRTLQIIDPNVAGEFLVLAATLMEIKSRMLLPKPPAETAEEEDLSDPRIELVRQLLEYKKFKDASLELGQAAALASQRWPRPPIRPAFEAPATVDLEDVQIWDLVAAFNQVMAAIGAGAVSHDVVFDDTPIALHATDILDRLQREQGELTFESIFIGRGKVEMIGLFLALLELIRQCRVRVTQHGLFGAIKIVLLSAEPIEVGDEWMPAIREAALGAGPKSPDETPASPMPSASDSVDDVEDDESSFADLDRIKTDVDIDAILNQAAEKEKTEPSP